MQEVFFVGNKVGLKEVFESNGDMKLNSCALDREVTLFGFIEHQLDNIFIRTKVQGQLKIMSYYQLQCLPLGRNGPETIVHLQFRYWRFG